MSASSLFGKVLVAYIFLHTFIPTGLSAAGVEHNSDLLGHNIRSFTLGSPNFQECQQACQRERRCKAATYVKPGVQGPNARCYLKHTIVPRRANNCCITWVRDNAASQKSTKTVQAKPSGGVASASKIQGAKHVRPVQVKFTKRNNWDLRAPNLKRFTLNEPNPDLCKDACAGDKSCQGYTFVKPGIQGPQAVCYLKGKIQKAIPNNCCVSGARVPPPFMNLDVNSAQAKTNKQMAVQYKKNLQQFMKEAKMRLPAKIAQANRTIQMQQQNWRLKQMSDLRSQFQQSAKLANSAAKNMNPAAVKQAIAKLLQQKPSTKVAGKAQINQAVIKVIGPKPEVTGILTAPASPVKNYVREGGYVLLFGKNFGNMPGKVMLSYRTEPVELTSKKSQEMGVTLEPWQGRWHNAWQDTMVVARIPMLPPGFLLMNAKLVMWRDGQRPMKLEVPVHLMRRGAGVHSIKASPEYGDHINRDAAVFGGELMLTGEGFGDKPGKIYIELTRKINGMHRVELLPGMGTWAKSWQDRILYVKVPDLKANVPTQTAMLVIEPSYGGQGAYRRPISFGPRMVYALVTGKEFLELDTDAPDNWLEEKSPYLRVSHGPDCTWYRWFGSDGTDHFFRKKHIPANTRVVRAIIAPVKPDMPWTTWEIVIKEIGNLVDAFFGNPFDLARYFASKLGVVVGSLFDRNVGKYKADIIKMPSREDPRGAVRWYTTCLAFHPANDLPIVYITSFLIEGPAGYCPGEIMEQ